MVDLGEALAIFTTARGKITSPECWTKKCMARDADGIPVSPYSEEAKAFCAVGGLMRAAKEVARFELEEEPDSELWRVNPYLEELVSYFGIGELVTAFNDSNTTNHEAVLDLYDIAIQRIIQVLGQSRFLTKPQGIYESAD